MAESVRAVTIRQYYPTSATSVLGSGSRNRSVSPLPTADELHTV
jgi:hypothetical protein